MIAAIFLIGFILLGLLLAALPAIKREERERAVMEGQIANLPAFQPAVRFDQPDRALSLLLDPESSQFVLAKQKTNRGSQMMGAAVGGVLLGPVGLLLGGLTGSKRNEERVKRLSLKLFTSDLHIPVSEVIFFAHPQGVTPDSPLVKVAAEQLDAWHGRFRTILQGNERGASPLPSSPPTQDEATQPGSFGRRRGLIAQN